MNFLVLHRVKTAMKVWAISMSIFLLVVTSHKLHSNNRLNPSACQKMHSHQMKILRSNPGHPFVKSLNLKPGSLSGRAAQKSEIQFCMRYISQANYNCQMKAANITSLMGCYQKHAADYKRGYADVKRNPLDTSDKNPRPIDIGDTTLPDYNKDLKDEKVTSGNVIIEGAENMPNKKIALNASNCNQAYNHMLKMLIDAPDLAKLENKSTLIADWQSDKSRKAFTERCTEKFAPDDLGCILYANDREVLQACLLVISG